jgi:hypothetical protein
MMADSVLFNENGLFKVEHNRHVLDLGALTWSRDTKYSQSAFYAYEPSVMVNNNNVLSVPNILCTHYAIDSVQRIDIGEVDKAVSMASYLTGSRVWVHDSSYTDTTEFKNAMSGVLVEFIKTTPTIEVLDTESQLALHGLKTFDNVTYLESGNRTKPSEIEVEYGTSQVGAYTLQSLNNSEANAIRLDALLNAQVAEVAQEATEPTPATE